MTNSTTTPKTYNSLYVYAISLSAALGSLFFGYINSVMNPLQDYIQDNVYTTMSDSLMTLTSSLVPAGAAVGAFVAADMAKKVGRRNAMFITDAISILGVIITLIGNQYCLLFGRLISGVCVGFNSSVVPLYIAEVSPAEARGLTGSFTQLFVSTGILVAYLFGLNVPIGQDESDTKWWWRFMLGFGLLIAVVRSLILLVAFKSDTPKYLLANDKEEATIKVLEKIYKKDQVAEELSLLKKEKEINAQAGQIQYRDLISPQYRSRFVIGCLLAILQQFSGINAIIYYSTSLFEDPNDPNSKKPQIYTVVVGILTVTSAFIATLVIKRVGRRQLLLVGSVVLFIALILLPIVGWAAPDAGSASKYFIFLFILGHGFSLSSVVWIYISEILPDIGVGVATLLCWISCVIVAQVFPYLMDGIGSEATWLILACIVFAGFIFILKWVPETKGKQPHEIAALFSNSKTQDLEYVDKQTRKMTDVPEAKSDGAGADVDVDVEEKV